jgi:hypothetical protein
MVEEMADTSTNSKKTRNNIAHVNIVNIDDIIASVMGIPERNDAGGDVMGYSKTLVSLIRGRLS